MNDKEDRMGCVLRIYGTELDPDALLAEAKLVACAVHYKGQSRTRVSQRINERSGVHVSLSDASSTDVEGQVRDVIAFLKVNGPALRKAAGFAGVETALLDFAIRCQLGEQIAVQCEYLPLDLLKLAGDLGIGIEISIYPTYLDPDDQE